MSSLKILIRQLREKASCIMQRAIRIFLHRVRTVNRIRAWYRMCTEYWSFQHIKDCICRIQRAYRGCNRVVFSLRKRNKYIVERFVPGKSLVCPITSDTISSPVINMCDGRLYEASALTKWRKTKNTCPTTRKSPLKYVSVHKVNVHIDGLQKQIVDLRKEVENLRSLDKSAFFSHNRTHWQCKLCNWRVKRKSPPYCYYESVESRMKHHLFEEHCPEWLEPYKISY